MITYPKFIKELERLVADAKELRAAEDMHHNKKFRKWRPDLEAALNQIVQVDYLLPTPVRIQHRGFGYLPGQHTPEEFFESYQMEMDDTINELTLIIENYKKHGEPPKGGKRKEKMKVGLEWPGKITLSWLYHNAPISLWSWFVGLLLAAFVLGIQVADSQYYKEFKSTPESENK